MRKFGVEIEVTCSRSNFRKLSGWWGSLPYGLTDFTGYARTWNGWAIKSDLSIKPRGAEFISPPMTNMDELVADIKAIQNLPFGLHCNKTCGLHVHIEAPEEFRYARRVGTQEMMERIWEAERHSFRIRGHRKKEHVRESFWCGERYQILNTTNDKTFEFRCFNGCLDVRYITRAVRTSQKWMEKLMTVIDN